ncbi:hypothetical protein AQI88_29945 [Streptomyces cellostaticus]|uniref:Uncharacterized protein n=1 Tax=Streptomyces cellostaticus TaxID=67285 RepID=A0A117PUV6_9ACTN|nr:hypothetical protein [Streptomyces cellostaticus]KUM92782.1 hypothetical protein AQI88_29945 [Streptomyces cellostaticus]GHI06796.1 hypothetical protein Scel_51170 [Streptomyces cellostaticus]
MTTQPPPYGNQPPYGQQPPPPPATAPSGFGPPPPQYAYAPTPPQPPVDGPEFMAVDRHNSIVVDAEGVAFENHGLSADFPWQQIRSAHFKASPSGRALMLAVVLVDGRVFECVVEAKPRAKLGEWFAQLAAVLSYYRPMGS